MADFSALTVTIESAAIAEAIDLREKVRGLEAELAEARANLRLAELRINGFIAAQEDAAAEIAKLKPYALVQIAKLKRDSAVEELDGAEDEQERRQCASELEEWHEMAFRATTLMREQWERDRKTLVRVELGDMVKASVAKGGR